MLFGTFILLYWLGSCAGLYNCDYKAVWQLLEFCGFELGFETFVFIMAQA